MTPLLSRNLNVNISRLPPSTLQSLSYLACFPVYIELLSGCHLLFVSSRRRCVICRLVHFSRETNGTTSRYIVCSCIIVVFVHLIHSWLQINNCGVDAMSYWWLKIPCFSLSSLFLPRKTHFLSLSLCLFPSFSQLLFKNRNTLADSAHTLLNCLQDTLFLISRAQCTHAIRGCSVKPPQRNLCFPRVHITHHRVNTKKNSRRFITHSATCYSLNEQNTYRLYGHWMLMVIGSTFKSRLLHFACSC